MNESKTNYHSIQEPEFHITIGIKDGHVVTYDWTEMMKAGQFKKLEDKQKIIDYFKQAIRFLEKYNTEEMKF